MRKTKGKKENYYDPSTCKSAKPPPSSHGWVWSDFNEVLSPEEKIGCGPHHHGGLSEFAQAMNNFQLMATPSIGGSFTWTKSGIGISSNLGSTEISVTQDGQTWSGLSFFQWDN